MRFYTIVDTPSVEEFAQACGQGRRIKALIGIALEDLHVSAHFFESLSNLILCPHKPCLKDVKMKPVGAVNGHKVVTVELGQAFTDDTFKDLVLVEVDADASEVLDFYGRQPANKPAPARPVLRLRI